MLSRTYINNLLTDVSSWIDLMPSAKILAILKQTIFGHSKAALLRGMELVTTNSFIGEASIRLSAGPESTAWEQQA